MSSGKVSSDGDVDGEGDSDSDPFLGSGPSFRVMNISIDNQENSFETSPTLALRCNNKDKNNNSINGRRTAGRSGLLSLHDAKNEVYLLLDELTSIQESLKQNTHGWMFHSGRACALEELQKELQRRSELSYVGRSERRILRREAANLDRARDQARADATRAGQRNIGLEHPFLVKEKLGAALMRLCEEAQAALRTLEKVTGDATSDPACGIAPDSTARAALYPAWKDHHLTSLTAERRALQSQVEKLEREREQHRGDISRLQKQVDELLAERVS